MAAAKGNQYAKDNPKVTGRPETNPEDYNPKWKEEMLIAYKDGKSDTHCKANCFKKHIVSNDLWDRWIQDIKDFSETVKNGHILSMDWWEGVSQEHADGSKQNANATSLIFNMCNRFRNEYQQRQTVEQTTKHSLDIDNLDELREILEESGVDISKL